MKSEFEDELQERAVKVETPPADALMTETAADTHSASECASLANFLPSARDDEDRDQGCHCDWRLESGVTIMGRVKLFFVFGCG